MVQRNPSQRHHTGMNTPPNSDQEQLESSRTRSCNKRPFQNDPNSAETTSSEADDISDSGGERPRKVLRRSLSHISTLGSAFPRSCYNSEQPTSLSDQSQVISDLLNAFKGLSSATKDSLGYIYFELDNFSIYRPSDSKHAFELVTLDKLQNGRGCVDLVFDGTLSAGDEQRRVQGVHFQVLAVDGYGDANIDSSDYVSIQSPLAKRRNVWFRLRSPSSEYRRFFNPFLWLAQFTKFFVEYLLEGDRVCLEDFRSNFDTWLFRRHGDHQLYDTWSSACSLHDFRTTIAANVGYLWKECYSIDDRTNRLRKHPIWREVDPWQLKAIPKQVHREEKTILTPFAYHCFRRMYFHEYMECRDISDPDILASVSHRKSKLGLSPFGALEPPDAGMPTPRSVPEPVAEGIEVNEGDVVCVVPDLDRNWKNASSTWYAYVQRVHPGTEGIMLDVLWLYEPQDTTLREAVYPFGNELFLSDNCSCGKDALHISCVTGTVDVSWFATDPSAQTSLFARQKFRTVHEEDTYDFVSLEKSDFKCKCSDQPSLFEQCRQSYQIGDTVLAVEYSQVLRERMLEPSQVVDFDLDKRRVLLRRLKRKTDVDTQARPNELLLTTQLMYKGPSHIIRKCHIRSFMDRTSVPTPYDRDGVGDYYFLIETPDTTNSNFNQAQVETGEAIDLQGSEPMYPPVEQGWDPCMQPHFQKLKGMGIFCGGGNFDRGLEEGGMVEFKYAVDWAERALHSYRANLHDKSDTEFFLGSVNDYLAQAISGSTLTCIARPCDVDFISAGSPCPGFSVLQMDKQSPDSLRNASMVASVVSFVDFYSPQYCILENVVSMTHGMGAEKDENVFAQILAAFVGMGYQVQQFYMPAWCFGSSQSRPRVFIVASAPGLKPLRTPAYTHAHPTASRFMQHSLGKSSNGLRFGLCREEYTPFTHVSAKQSTSDLPNIGDSQPQLCPAFPDHRTPSEESFASRERMAAVPIRPHGMSLEKAANKDLLRGEPLEYFNRLGHVRQRIGSRTYSRLAPNKLFPTVTTVLRITDGVGGPALHWSQNRALTVMELRRAQGFLDREVIIGSPAQQVTIAGNSVDRKAALVLGLAFRESWSKSRPATDGENEDSEFESDDAEHARAFPKSAEGQVDGAYTEDSDNDFDLTMLSYAETESVRRDSGNAFQMIQQILHNRDGSYNEDPYHRDNTPSIAAAIAENRVSPTPHNCQKTIAYHLRRRPNF